MERIKTGGKWRIEKWWREYLFFPKENIFWEKEGKEIYRWFTWNPILSIFLYHFFFFFILSIFLYLILLRLLFSLSISFFPKKVFSPSFFKTFSKLDSLTFSIPPFPKKYSLHFAISPFSQIGIFSIISLYYIYLDFVFSIIVLHLLFLKCLLSLSSPYNYIHII